MSSPHALLPERLASRVLTAFTDPVVGFEECLPVFNDDTFIELASVAPLSKARTQGRRALLKTVLSSVFYYSNELE